MKKDFCFGCDGSGEAVVWFKTKDHYLDLKNQQLEDFLREVKKAGFVVDYDRDKRMELSYKKQKFILLRHECGPEILLGLGYVASIFAIVDGVVKIVKFLRKILQSKNKETKEKPIFKIYINKIEIDFSSDSKLKEAISDFLSRKEIH
ncbi:MAG: hypothetical protein PHO48_01600 [Candidatus Gracilibacteria bacterium]|jgi:hypothetical protein|nr:hypothetical protein [Candidatus Gracilibacteria bacterium]MDD5178955.1 hypothetical protein [Candidatus Gracilibacteria bacterium]